MKGRLRAPTLILHTKRQWRTLMKGVRTEEVKRAPRGAAFTAFVIPGTELTAVVPTCPDGHPYLDSGRTQCVPILGPRPRPCGLVYTKRGIRCEGQCGIGVAKCKLRVSRLGQLLYFQCVCKLDQLGRARRKPPLP